MSDAEAKLAALREIVLGRYFLHSGWDGSVVAVVRQDELLAALGEDG